MAQIGKREFADAEIPVRMTGPLNIHIVPEIKTGLDILALELVDDYAIVDAMDGDVAVIQAVAAFANDGERNGFDTAIALRHEEIGERLLMVRIDFHQYHVFGI